MKDNVSRRHFIAATAAAASATMIPKGAQATPGKILILGISASPRKGKTTAVSVQAALDAAAGLPASFCKL